MSRIGKKVIEIPKGTEVSVSVNNEVVVKGPLGELKKIFLPNISVLVEDNKISFSKNRNDLLSSALWGTYASHVNNMVAGVNKPFEKKLQIEGIGFKSEVTGEDLSMSLGFSHPVKVKIPTGLKVSAEKNLITISGINKELVGQFAAKIRSIKKPEPYKGKGIRYIDEVVKRKQGKKSA